MAYGVAVRSIMGSEIRTGLSRVPVGDNASIPAKLPTRRFGIATNAERSPIRATNRLSLGQQNRQFFTQLG